tara:strand:+ start:1386 stop:3437 length:2052 start_codon:yes stop_codon:yes gene_type:complete
MAKRKYRKTSDYWGKFKKKSDEPLDKLLQQKQQEGWNPVLAGDSFYAQSSHAQAYSRRGSSNQMSSNSAARQNRVATFPKYNDYANIRDGMLPYDFTTEGVNIREAVILCQKAYANIAIFRNALDIMAEFANSELYLEGGTKTSRDFITKWFQKISIWKITDQYFREYYKSGNVFIYRVDGKFNQEDFQKLSLVYGSQIEAGTIPLRYIFLNPFDIVTVRAASFKEGIYRKVLSDFELERLKNPKTDEDMELFSALPEETQELITKGSWHERGIAIPLEVGKLSYSFYKKQDYEPFAIPFGFPVLADLNWKMELKKIDAAICRTIENVILIITMGNTPDKGGINPQNMHAMQQLFRNESIGRVLVSDYTTKAEFIIPDLNKVIGPDKYKVVNEDIKEGLQNVIVGQERYASTMVKAEIFLERLKEARNAFINDFMQPQIKMVCKSLGFRKYPIVRFSEIDLKDELQMHRVTTRLMELGVITPQEGLRAIKTGIYPETQNMEEAQEKFLDERRKGYYNPLVGGVPVVPDLDEDGNEAPKNPDKIQEIGNTRLQDVETIKPSGPSKQAGRPLSSSDPEKIYTRASLQEVIASVEGVRKSAGTQLRKKTKKKRLNKQENKLLDNLCESVISSCPEGKWTEEVRACIKNFDHIADLAPLNDILDLSARHDLALYPAALLYHSGKISQ